MGVKELCDHHKICATTPSGLRLSFAVMEYDHYRLFKELLSTFFVEFIDLFLPDVSAALGREAGITAIDKEVYTDVTLGEKHEVGCVDEVPVPRRGCVLPHPCGESGISTGRFPEADVQVFRSFDGEVRPAGLIRW